MDDASILHFIRFPVFYFGAKKVHVFKELSYESKMDDASILHFIRFLVFCFGAKKVHL
jgi:hypothetical protein